MCTFLYNKIISATSSWNLFRAPKKKESRESFCFAIYSWLSVLLSCLHIAIAWLVLGFLSPHVDKIYELIIICNLYFADVWACCWRGSMREGKECLRQLICSVWLRRTALGLSYIPTLVMNKIWIFSANIQHKRQRINVEVDGAWSSNCEIS